MARDFNGTTSKITGTITAADSGDWSIGAWFNIDGTGEGSSGVLFAAQDAGTFRNQAVQLNSSSRLNGTQRYTTTSATAQGLVISTGTWYCAVITFRASDSTVRIYSGTLAAAMVESSYATQQVGVGTRSTSGTTATLGNDVGAFITWDGRIEHGFFTARELSLDEMERFRQGDFTAILGTELRFYTPLTSPDATIAEDLSGNGIAFTSTSAAVAEGPPIPWGAVDAASTLTLAGTDGTATPAAIAVTVTVPAVTKLATSTTTPSPITAPTTFPSATLSGTGITTPSAIAVPVTVPQVIAQSTGSGQTNPSPIAVPVSFPAPSFTAISTITPDPIAVAVTLPQPAFVADINLTPDPIQVTVTVPTPDIQGNITATAHPNPINITVTLPMLTANEMFTFAPPATDTYPAVLPDSRGPARSLFRHMRSRARGVNVYLVDGQITTNDPVTTYAADGSVIAVSWDRVENVWWGGHDPEEVSDPEAVLLAAAGYTLGQDVLVGA